MPLNQLEQILKYDSKVQEMWEDGQDIRQASVC